VIASHSVPSNSGTSQDMASRCWTSIAMTSQSHMIVYMPILQYRYL
jgi:hypothetical protein